MLGDKRLIERLKIKNLLSFSSTGIDIELKSLNILIGPNASGKSNFIETIGLLKSLPTDFAQGVRDCGGIYDLLWKGCNEIPVAEIEATIDLSFRNRPMLCHKISFTKDKHDRLKLIDEAVEDAFPMEKSASDIVSYYRFNKGNPVIIDKKITLSSLLPPILPIQLKDDQSILSQRKGWDNYPEITYLNFIYEKIKLFREWNMSRYTSARKGQRTDINSDFLNESFDNLSLVFNYLEFQPDMKGKVLDHLKIVYDRVEDIKTLTLMGQIQTYIDEGLKGMIPAMRLSDGTIRYLCLLLILLHPEPPPLICLEEPELGLHPDIVHEVANLLVDASHKTQLIVTTHSTSLIDALSDDPEAVIVCENCGEGTEMKRLEKEDLTSWLRDYSLGDVWMRGAIGGTRW